MVATARAPLRIDRLRALNLPLRVDVELDVRGHPLAIRRRQDGIPTSPSPSPRHDGINDTGAMPSCRRGMGRGGRVVIMPSCASDECRRVEAVGEVWRVDDEWWRQPVSRRYVEVVLEGGKHMVLFEDLMTAQWWLQQP